MSINAGAVEANTGVSGVKDASVCSNVGMDCGAVATHGDDGMHRGVGFGVIADNLMNIATFASARAIG